MTRRWRPRRWIFWLRGDPARRAEAALALAATREASGSGLNARAALQTAVESAPESASFWIAAASDARAGRRSDAAAALGLRRRGLGGERASRPGCAPRRR